MLVKMDKQSVASAPLRSTGLIGSDIRALRRSRNWTLSDLANHLERSVGWLSQVERGVSEPALEDIRRIAGLFNLPVSFFFSSSKSFSSISLLREAADFLLTISITPAN